MLNKILYLQSTSEVGGSDIALLRTLEVLDRSKFEPHVLLPYDGPLVEAFRKTKCHVHFFPSMRKLTSRKGIRYLCKYAVGYLLAIIQITRLIKREKIDLVHTNDIHNLYGFLAAKLARKPHVWHVRTIVIQSIIARWLETLMVRRGSDKFIVMDNAISEQFLLGNNNLPSNLVKLYDGIDVEEFHPKISGKRIRSELGVAENIPLIGIICRLDPWKGLEIFLEMAACILRVQSEVKFLVCGGEIEGHEGYENKLMMRTKLLGIQENVIFAGWRYNHTDIPEVCRALDVSVQCPRYPEPYGLVNIEAMASGVPIVAVAEGGPTELCVDGETALLVPPNNPQAAAEAVLSLLNNPDRARVMGKAGRIRAEKLFDRKQCVKEIEKLYENVINL